MDQQVATQKTTLKLDLASGQKPREGFEGVDIVACPGVKHIVNLWRFPWPWEDSSVAELHCSHHLEHIPMSFVSPDGHYRQVPESTLEVDLLARFMDECWRILVPDGVLTVVVPNARNNRGFQDFTHRRFFVAESFLYFNAEWRRMAKVDHYNVQCNFGIQVAHSMDAKMNLVHSDEQARRLNESWNVIWDWHVTLKAIKS